jgi:hypothetical protein
VAHLLSSYLEGHGKDQAVEQGADRVAHRHPSRAQYERGLDFADALHLALAHDAEALATFDAKLARRAARLSPARVMAL